MERGGRTDAWWALALVGLAACASEVRVEDDDGGDAASTSEGGDEDGSAVGSDGAPAAGPTTSASTGSGEGEAATEAARAACFDYFYSCNHLDGGPLGVDYDTCDQLQTRPECASLLQALYECATQPGGNDHMSCDFELEDGCDEKYGFDYRACVNARGCGDFDVLECDAWDDATGCSCTEPCRDGHTSTVSCRPSDGPGGTVCDCSFDGASIGQCTNPTSAHDDCWFQLSCCQLLIE